MNGMELLETAAGGIALSLWNVSWQVFILAAFALVADRLYRNAPPSFRYWLWMLVLARFAVPLHISLPYTFFLPAMENAVFDSLPMTGVTSQAVDIVVQAGKQMDLAGVLGILWLAGLLLILLYLVMKAVRTNRLLSAGTEPVTRSDLRDLLELYAPEMGIRTGIGLLVSRDNAIPAPAVIGVLRPRIILPHGIVAAWSARDIEPLLLHELVHIQRRDLLVNWLQILVHAVYFFHPVVWLANSRIRKAREEMCDDISIIRLRTERERYSLSMIRIGEEFLAHRTFTIAEAGFSENGSSIGGRVRRIMHGNYSPHRRLTAGTIIALCAVVVFGVLLACDRSAVRVEKGQTRKTELQTAGEIRKNSLKVTVLNDSTFEVGGKRVTRADFARVVRERLPRYNYNYYLDGSPEVSVKTLEFATQTASGAGAGPFGTAPSVNKKLRDAGVFKDFSKILRVTVVDDTTFDAGGVLAGRSDLEHVLKELLPQYDSGVEIRKNNDTSSETVKFLMDTVSKAGAKGILSSTQPEPDFKPRLVVGIIDRTLFRFEGRHWIVRADLEREFRQRLPLYDNKAIIFGKKDTPEELIQLVKDTAMRAGAKEVSYEVSTAKVVGIQVHILDDATFVVEDTRVARADLERTFKELMPDNEYTTVISGYPDTSTETIRFVMDSAKRAGAKSLGLDPSINRQMMDEIIKIRPGGKSQ